MGRAQTQFVTDFSWFPVNNWSLLCKRVRTAVHKTLQGVIATWW